MTLFNIPQAKRRITGEIKKNLGSGWYVMKDTPGKQYRVAGTGYKVGDTVAVIDNQIVAKAGKGITPKTFQV